MNKIKIIILLCFLYVTGCSFLLPHHKDPNSTQNTWSSIKFLESIENTIAYLKKTNKNTITGKDFSIDKDQYLIALHDLASFVKDNPQQDQILNYLDSHFRVASKESDAFFTGYYTPTIHGSLIKTVEFIYPIYSKPTDLVSIQLDPSISSTLSKETPVINRGQLIKRTVKIPYCSRKEIETTDCLKGKAQIIAYAKDPLELFFLHIQGSGSIKLPSGDLMHLSFADKNGHPYRAIGATMIAQGKLKKGTVTMQSMKKYLYQHSDEVTEILHSNPSYVFLNLSRDVPRGNLGIPVTALHSFASDQAIVPPGVLALIDIESSTFSLTSHPMFNHDIGGAIRGRDRFDLYIGSDERASELAGSLQSSGRIQFLLPR